MSNFLTPALGLWWSPQLALRAPARHRVAVETVEPGLFLGDDLLGLLVLALGAAMVVGNAAALLRPPEDRSEGDLEQAPRVRSIVMIVIGALAAVWALASLLSS